jgi:hypothetical protein
MKINVSSSNRIDETIEGMDSEKKLKFAGMLCEYIENNIQAFAVMATKKTETMTLFEKSRETNMDRGLKFKLINHYNNLLQRFSKEKSLV